MNVEENYRRIIQFLKKKHIFIILILLLLATGVRLYYFSKTVDQPLWWDEGDYMSYAKRIGKNLNINDIWYYRRTFFLPLFWGAMFRVGFGEGAIRFTEVLFSLGAVIFTYLLGKEMFNKTVGLVAATGMASSRLVLFLGTRFITSLPAMFLFIAGLWFFWKGYVKKQNNKFILLAGLFIGLSIFTRFAMFLSLIPLGIYLLLNEKGKFWKNKHILFGLLIIFLILTPFFIKYNQHYGGVGDFIKHYTDIGKEESEEKTEYLGVKGIWGYINSISLNIGKVFSVFVIIGLSIFLNLLCIDKIFVDKKVRKSLFILLWILVPLIFHGMFSEVIQERYLLWAYPIILILGGVGVQKTYNYFKKYNKIHLTSIIFILLIILISFNSYGQLKMGDQLITSKLDSFKAIKDASIWMKENSKPGDIIMSNSIPQTQYYSEREVYMPANVSHLESYKPKFIMISIFERSPDWFYLYPKEEKLNAVQVYFINNDQSQPALMVYEL